MKKRHTYVLFFAIPAFLASLIVAGLVLGAGAGALWLFVFGDNPWPSAAGNALAVGFILAFAACWIGLLSAAYAAGKKHEDSPGFDARVVWASSGATALLVLLVVAHQRSVGNLGPKDDGTLCSAFCQARGHSGSGMPPRNSGDTTCSCYDAQGREAVKAPIEKVREEVRAQAAAQRN